MFQVMVIGPVKNLALTEIIEGFVKFELIFCDKGLYINFELVLLAPGNKLEALIVSLNLLKSYFLEKHFVNVLINVTVVDDFRRGFGL